LFGVGLLCDICAIKCIIYNLPGVTSNTSNSSKLLTFYPHGTNLSGAGDPSHRCTGVPNFGDAKNFCPNMILFFPNNV